MKKAIIVVITAVIVIAAGIGTFFVIRNSTSGSADGSKEKSVFNEQQIRLLRCFRDNEADAVKGVISDEKLSLWEDGGEFGFEEYDINGLKLSAFYSSEDDRITNEYFRFDAGIKRLLKDPVSDKEEDKCKASLSTITELCNTLFGVDVYDCYGFYDKNGLPLDKEQPPIKKLLQGETKFALFVRDVDGSLWKIYGEMTDASDYAGPDEDEDENAEYELIFSFTRYFDTELFKDVSADITLKK